MDFVVKHIDHQNKTVTLGPHEKLAIQKITIGGVSQDANIEFRAGDKLSVKFTGVPQPALRIGQTYECEITRETWPLLFGVAPIPDWVR